MPDPFSAVPAAAGIGLRFQHHEAIRQTRPAVAWLEVHTENYMGGGPSIRVLEAIRRDCPVSLHGVGLSLGSAEGLDALHLGRVREVVRRIQPGLVSEHLSWSNAAGTYLADLLPLPMTEEALAVVCRHVEQTQDYLQRRILVENPSSYLCYRHSTIPEWDFLAAVAQRSGMTKLANWDTALALFADEYRVPLLSPELAAAMAAGIELSTPVLLVLGLLARPAAAVLLGMTAVIEIFVYPQAWPTHIQWAAMLLILLCRGPGALSLDHWLRQTIERRKTRPRGLHLR